MDNRDGTYDVKFDDGDRDRKVPEGLIKKAGGSNSRDRSSAFDSDVDDKLREGDKVESRCKGSRKYYPGKIFMDNRDGTYDVKFDDGDRDRKVPEGSIKKQGGGASRRDRSSTYDSDADTKLREGDKVEARCKGSTRYYPGKIFMDNRDGTYDVKFDDGDRDRKVPKRSIKKVGGSSKG